MAPVRNPELGASVQELPPLEAPPKILWPKVRGGAGRGKDRFKIWDLFADERCSRAVLDFPATTDVGGRAPDLPEEDPQSKVSEWEPKR